MTLFKERKLKKIEKVALGCYVVFTIGAVLFALIFIVFR